jgi:putative ABC transport system permease protein
MLRDVRLAFRALTATPVISIVAVLSLALGIGANTAVFSVVEALLLKKLPVSEPQRLVTVSSDFALGHGYRNGIGWNYEMWRRFEPHSPFESGFAWTWATFNLAAGGPADRVHGMIASGGFFKTLGVHAIAGRTFTEADDVRGGGPDGAVAVISHALWQRRYAGGNVIGTPITLDGIPFTIIGVTPPEFFGIEVGESLDVVVPLGTDPLLKGSRTLLDDRGALLLTVMLRLKPAQSLESATAEIRGIQPAVIDDSGRPLPSFLKDPYVLVPAGTGSTDKSQLRQRYEQPIVAIAVVVGLVLLVACVNIANLLLARAVARRHEFSVRLALGAPRGRLARQLFVESLVLSGLGAIAGLAFGMGTSHLLVSELSPTGDPVFVALSFDWRVIAFTGAIAIATALVFGTAPAFQVTRMAPFDALRGRTSNIPSSGVIRGLVVVQVAFTLVLVAAAGLFLSTFTRLNGVSLGFDAERVLVATVDTSAASTALRGRDQAAPALVVAAAAAPGVAHAAGSIATPGAGGGANLMTDARGRAVDVGRRVMVNAVTPGWFSTYGMPVGAGRDFRDTDTANALPVAVVNETFAREFFPGVGAVGREFDDSATDKKRTIVGVVPDVVYGSRRDRPGPQAYLPLTQSGGLGPGLAKTTLQISVCTNWRPTALIVKNLGAALAAVDPKLSFDVRIVGDSERAALSQERIVAVLSGFFGTLAALLAGLGLYGITSYGISRRQTEIGVRMALGGSSRNIVRVVLSQTAVLVSVGVLIGIIASVWLSQFVSALLYGLAPRNVANLLTSAVILLIVAAASVTLPACRATQIDPAELLRSV